MYFKSYVNTAFWVYILLEPEDHRFAKGLDHLQNGLNHYLTEVLLKNTKIARYFHKATFSQGFAIDKNNFIHVDGESQDSGEWKSGFTSHFKQFFDNLGSQPVDWNHVILCLKISNDNEDKSSPFEYFMFRNYLKNHTYEFDEVNVVQHQFQQFLI